MIKSTLAILAGVLTTMSVPVAAQGLLDSICQVARDSGETATEAQYATNPLAYADDFCALANFNKIAAARQLSKAVAQVRSANNRNRFYFDPKMGAEPGLYVQLLRPWMKAQNAAGIADWQVLQRRDDLDYSLRHENAIEHGIMIVNLAVTAPIDSHEDDAWDGTHGAVVVSLRPETTNFFYVSYDHEVLLSVRERRELGYWWVQIGECVWDGDYGPIILAADAKEYIERVLDRWRDNPHVGASGCEPGTLSFKG